MPYGDVRHPLREMKREMVRAICRLRVGNPTDSSPDFSVG